MWCGADDEQGCYACDGEDEDPVRDIKDEALVRAEGFEKPLLLNQTQTPHREFHIRWPAPNRCDDREGDITLYIAAECHGVVE